MENVNYYTIASGHAFDGITLYGIFDTIEAAEDCADDARLDSWEIVPIYDKETVRD